MYNTRALALATAVAFSMLGAGCAKKKAAAAWPPAIPAATRATGPQTASATTSPNSSTKPVTISSAPSTAASQPTKAEQVRIDQLLAKIQDAYFDYDRHSLRSNAVKALSADVTELQQIIKNYPSYKLTIEGHCDERGSAEYNMGLGNARAAAAKDFLVQFGVSASQLAVISYGKERPMCQEHDEECWQKNRRAHIVAMAQPAAR